MFRLFDNTRDIEVVIYAIFLRRLIVRFSLERLEYLHDPRKSSRRFTCVPRRKDTFNSAGFGHNFPAIIELNLQYNMILIYLDYSDYVK